jgi:hypothetical protein
VSRREHTTVQKENEEERMLMLPAPMSFHIHHNTAPVFSSTPREDPP